MRRAWIKRVSVPVLLCSLAVVGLPASPRAAPSPTSEIVMPDKDEGVTTEYAVGTVLVSGFNVAAILNNTGGHAHTPSSKWGYMGVLGGLLGVGLGGATLLEDTSHETRELGVVNLGIGAVATISGALAIAHSKREPSGKPAVVSQAPVHIRAGVVGHGAGVGVTF